MAVTYANKTSFSRFMEKREELQRLAEARDLRVSFVGDQSHGNYQLTDGKRIAFPIVVGQTEEEISMMDQMQFNGTLFTPQNMSFGEYSGDYSMKKCTGRISPFSVEIIEEQSVNDQNSNGDKEIRQEVLIGVNTVGCHHEVLTGKSVVKSAYEGKRIKYYQNPWDEKRTQMFSTGVFRLERI